MKVVSKFHEARLYIERAIKFLIWQNRLSKHRFIDLQYLSKLPEQKQMQKPY